MTRIIFSAMLLTGIVATAQTTDGRVGINTTNPQATLEVAARTANDNATQEGLLVPRVSKNKAFLMATATPAPTESQLIYVNNLADYSTTPVAASVADITENGYYHWSGSRWVKVAGQSAGQEWIYDATTNKIDLRRSGATPFNNHVYYANNGQLINSTNTQSILSGYLTGTNPVIYNEVITPFQDYKARSIIFSESSKIPAQTSTSGTGQVSTSKRNDLNSIIVESSDTTQTFNNSSYSLLIPQNNANNYLAMYSLNATSTLAGSGTISNAIGLNGTVINSNTQNVSGYITGVIGTSAINSNSTLGRVHGIIGRNFFYSNQGATVSESSGGLFSNEMPFPNADNSLINNFYGANIIANNRSRNTGTGDNISGINNTVVQGGATKYNFVAGLNSNTSVNGNTIAPNSIFGIRNFVRQNSLTSAPTNMYGFYNNSIVTTGTVAPQNHYGLYIENISGATELNRAIHTEAGQIRFGDLAGTTATSTNAADKIVVVDNTGVLKTRTTADLAASNEWVYDSATNRINLRRSGTAPFTNTVYYDNVTGNHINTDADSYPRYSNVTSSILQFPVSKARNTILTKASNLTAYTDENIKANTSNILVLDNNDAVTGTVNRRHGTESTVILDDTYANNTRNIAASTNVVESFATSGSARYIWGTNGSAIVRSGALSMPTNGYMAGVRGESFWGSTSNTTEVTGGMILATTDANAGTVSNLAGITTRANSNSQNVENQYAINASNDITSSAGTVTNLYGFRYRVIGDDNKISNNYGIYLGDINNATNSNYSIYTNAGKIRFGDNVGVGVDNPTEKLEVAGAVKVGTTTNTCNDSNRGTIKFENDNFYGCKSTGWVLLNN